VAEPGLDADKMAALERWAAGLQGDTRPEVAASGRAILMLIEEIERLHVLLWGRSLYPQDAGEDPMPAPAAPDVVRTLRERLRIHRRPKTVDPPEAAVIHSESTAP
jgi:hypothetical protein